ncbi:MAG TPA: DUF3276 family protein [Bacteroidales bacterium]|nr:DUF3276 family protein [Bacteroidales bacterium]HRR94483.1 DUF3276 family protein [Bacteroidales bacterium]HRT89680.1 DUF3276 family protein [Bacteroidales bacterium]
MEEETGVNIENDGKAGKEEIYTKVVRAGKRTYFFDVKATRSDDYYLTITESKKRAGKEGKVFYEKHKIFLYKEDFEKFAGGLNDVVNFISNGKPVRENVKTIEATDESVKEAGEPADGKFTSIEFEELGKV